MPVQAAAPPATFVAPPPPPPPPPPAPIIDPEKEELRAQLAAAREAERVRKEKELVDAGNWKGLAEQREAENRTLREQNVQLTQAATVGKAAESVLLGAYNFDPAILPSVLALIDLSAAKVNEQGQIVGVEEAVNRAAAKHAALFAALPKRGAAPPPPLPDAATPDTFVQRVFGTAPKASPSAPPTTSPAINPNPAPPNLAERKSDGTFAIGAEEYSALKRRLTSPSTYRGASRRGV